MKKNENSLGVRSLRGPLSTFEVVGVSGILWGGGKVLKKLLI